MRPSTSRFQVARAPGLAWLLAALLLAQSASGQERFRYRVEIEVPDTYRPLLEENLDIYRRRDDPDMNLDFLRRLYARTPREIEALLATEGFYSPRIAASLEREADVWTARFDVEPGEPVRVEDVAIRFSGHIVTPEAQAQERIERLQQAWALEPGEVFRQEAWEAAKRALLRALLIDRYPGARIADSRAVVDPESGTARLEVEVDSGPLFTFGELRIEGLERYPRSVIENLSPIEPGMPYNQARIITLQQRLYDSAYFGRADVEVDIDPAHPKHAPVMVRVTENPSRRLGFGVGFSTNTGARGQVEYTDLNIRERAWRLNTGLVVDQVRYAVSGDLAFPARADGTRDSIVSSYTHQEIEGEVTDTTRVGVSRSRRVGAFDRTLTLQYLYEERDVAGAPDDIRRALPLNASWTRRATNHPLYPTRGYMLNVQAGGAHEAVLSEQSFARGYARGLRYFPAGASGNLLVRLELGVVAAGSRIGIPSDFLFRAGGDQSVRGYPFNSLGVPEGDAIVGGRYLAVGSVEYNYWFRERWGAAAFYDLGDAADERDDLEPVAGYGIGARWRSPVGPVNLDVAYGEEVERYRLHFAVGFVF